MAALDLNHATRAELLGLPGIGPALADRILIHRDRIHGFSRVDDLVHVTGISERVLEPLKPLLALDGPAPSPAGAPGFDVTVVVDDGGAGGDFTGHKISVSGVRRDPALGTVPFVVTVEAEARGRAVVALPSRESLTGTVTVRLAAPDGTVRGRTEVEAAKLGERVSVAATAQPRPTPQPNDDPAAGRPARIRGQVVDANGRQTTRGLQVVLWGAEVADPADRDFHALIVATTDGAGNFSGPYPVGPFSQTHATVAVGAGTQTVPVHLEDGELPASVILVVDLPDADPLADDDCDCHAPPDAPRNPDATDLGRADGTYSIDLGTGRCVDFTKPNRTLEEFSFTYLVRTTEPEIRGLTLAEPPRVPLRDLLGHVRDLGIAQQPTAMRATTVDSAPVAAAVGESASMAVRLDPAVSVDARVLKTLARDPDGFSLTTIADAARRTVFDDVRRYLGAAIATRPGRNPLTCATPVDWDDDPTIYQACTIAHGHVLRFKQEWVADGYSMGNLLYSLPLAPGQKKYIAVVDWERREVAARTESLSESESLAASLSRDRDISDVVNGTISESTRGGSSSSGGGIGGGLGVGVISGAVGAVLGIGGGYSSATSSAWQDSSRSTAASALNQLRDRTMQSATAVRNQRSSVVQTVTQGEQVTATTEVVANYNHCHAITVQYFEVLRHLLVRQRLADVQECLFVPLLMSRFDFAKALRWRHSLATAVPRRLVGALDAVDRIAHQYVGSDLPTGRYADDSLEMVEGELRLRFQLTRPRDTNDQFDPAMWSPLLKLFGFDAKDFYDNFLKQQNFKDRVFLEQLGPRIANAVIGLLRIVAVRTDGSEVDLRIDPTLVSRFANDQTLLVTLRMAADLPPVTRADIKAVVISSRLNLPGLPFVIDALPAGSRVVVESGSLRYRTAHLSDALFADAFIRNDLTGTDDVRIPTPLNRRELRNPREEDKEAVRDLLGHLNEHIERYHHHLWKTMGDHRRYMLLDGFEAPNSGGKSVASVVDNELIGIVGNCLVLPVARGFHLDPTFAQDGDEPVDLFDHYAPNTPIEPTRIALPTSGVYAEAVMGACNSCEEKEESRFWRWEESPIPDSPPAILPVSTDSRRSDSPDLTAKDFPAPIIAMQSAPAAPDPTGLAGALALLGQSGLFKDITGLEGTQRNAAAALEQAFNAATTMGTKAADLALQGKMAKDVDKAMKTINTAKQQGLITDEQAGKLTETAIRAMVGGGATNPPAASTTDEVKQLTETAGSNNAAVKVTRPTGEQVEVDARPAAGSADTKKPIIILDPATESADTRAFRPSAHDLSGVVTVSGQFRNAPEGAALRWSSPTAGALTIDSPNAATTRVRGVTPGRHDLDVELRDSVGTRLASIKLKMSVPQFVTVGEDPGFDACLTSLGLSAHKADMITAAKAVVDDVLATANVRVCWQVGGRHDAVPAHVPAGNVMHVTLMDRDPSPDGNVGLTKAPGDVGRFDEQIEVYVGEYDQPDAIDVDTETQALLLQLKDSLGADPALEAIATTIYGRLIGETMAHEIVHGLLWDEIGGDPFHNDPAIAGDLMNKGVHRDFRARTGMQNTRQASPVRASDYVDHGLGTIDRLKAANQAKMDQYFPVPPATL